MVMDIVTVAADMVTAMVSTVPRVIVHVISGIFLPVGPLQLSCIFGQLNEQNDRKSVLMVKL